MAYGLHVDVSSRGPHYSCSSQKVPVPPERASSQSPKKLFSSIIEHLSVVFPWYSRYEYKTFMTVKYFIELMFPDQIKSRLARD